MQGDVLPDLLSGLNRDWTGEGRRIWLLTDYKEGKAFSSLSGGLLDLYVLLETGTEQKGEDKCTALHLS